MGTIGSNGEPSCHGEPGVNLMSTYGYMWLHGPSAPVVTRASETRCSMPSCFYEFKIPSLVTTVNESRRARTRGSIVSGRPSRSIGIVHGVAAHRPLREAPLAADARVAFR